MTTQVLATKLNIPAFRPNAIARPCLIERLNEGLHRKLILVSAPAGYGKTTLVSEWLVACHQLTPGICAAWLSLDEADGDLARFLTYLVAALRTVAPGIGEGVLAALESPQAPHPETMLTILLNEVAALPDNFILVLDDYHLVDAEPVDRALGFLVERLPQQMHLVVATREDPPFFLARLRARGELTELRAADLSFTLDEAAEFLNRAMSLNLSAENVTALETRTEGWIAGLQLAALALQAVSPYGSGPQREQAVSGFIRSFTGTHRFVLDYLLEEVLRQQPEGLQAFLLRTSILDRLCGPLCDAVCSLASSSMRAFPSSGCYPRERFRG